MFQKPPSGAGGGRKRVERAGVVDSYFSTWGFVSDDQLRKEN